MKAAKGTPIRVLVVEDSRAQRELLVGLLAASSDFEVAGTAATGHEAVAATQRLRPDVIAMDIQLPGQDGYAATREIMQECPTPIVMISSDQAAARRSVEALAVGALAVVAKPGNLYADSAVHERSTLLTTLRLMAGVPVVTRHRQRAQRAEVVHKPSSQPQLLAIAASTGGPVALQTVLRDLGPDLPMPIIVVQHIANGFIGALAEWLGTTVPQPVHLAEPKTPLINGHVYLPPEGHHLVVESRGMVGLRPPLGMSHYCPSADELFHSVARTYGSQAIGVMLTGMGDDGTRGIKALHESGGTTIAQDEASCVVYGMPRAAVVAGAITHVEPLSQIGTLIRHLARSTQRPTSRIEGAP